MNLRQGEQSLCTFDNVEDTKGNPGLLGILVVSNMRLLWYIAGRKFNLSVGLDTIEGVLPGKMVHKTIGKQVVLLAAAKSKFEFIFTSDDVGLFKSIQAVVRAFDKSRLYREVQLRTRTIRQGRLELLHQEKLFDTVSFLNGWALISW